MSANPWPPSLWHDTLADDERLGLRPPLDGDDRADVVIVGAGYTGLWTAYYLAGLAPGMRIMVIERERAGFGASGRNGGWCTATLAMSNRRLAEAAGGNREAAVRMIRAMNDTVDEVGRVAATEGIDCGYSKGGTIYLARTAVHQRRLQAELADDEEWGLGDDGHVWLDADEARSRLHATDVRGALYTPHCARIHPARLARGLARAAERRGVVIHEDTAAISIEPGRVVTSRGVVRAGVVVRATEGYTAQLKGYKRAIAPVYSLMIATEPLPESVWEQIGLRRMETFNDARRLVIYGQRTWDGRLAFGGRGAPYHWGSAIEPHFDQVPRVHDLVRDTLVELFPVLRNVAITHRWGGPLGIPRDWFSHVGYDRVAGLASAGGYVGDGVAASNLAGRTLAELIAGEETERTSLLWVGHQSRLWEPEPLRWAGINGMLRLNVQLDRTENRTGRTPRVRSAVIDRLIG